MNDVRFLGGHGTPLPDVHCPQDIYGPADAGAASASVSPNTKTTKAKRTLLISGVTLLSPAEPLPARS